jgi:hypothetical protein
LIKQQAPWLITEYDYSTVNTFDGMSKTIAYKAQPK